MLKWTVVSCQPFSVVEETEFIDLIKLLNPSAELMSSKTLKEDLMAAYLQHVEQIKGRLIEVPGKMSVTLDIWTSKNVLSFLVIRAHWISKDWQYNTQMLDFAPIEEHDGKNQSRIFVECIDRFGIPLKKILAYIMDNASSNSTFIDFLRIHGIAIGSDIDEAQIRCLAHILNLAVHDILDMIIGPVSPKKNGHIHIEKVSIFFVEFHDFQIVFISVTSTNTRFSRETKSRRKPYANDTFFYSIFGRIL